MAKYKYGAYHKDYFCGGNNIDLNLIMCEDKIFVSPIIQRYVLHWYHTYLLHPGIDITGAMIYQHMYWPGIREPIHKEVNNCDNYQRTK